MTDKLRLAILLPTYNGEQYLRQQLDSLLAQHHGNFVIVSYDDASTDSSAQIIANYAENYPQHFHIVANAAAGEGGNLGASAAFSLLMKYTLENKAQLGLEQAYMMCCDQDDVWYPHKIATCVERLRVLESQSAGIPLLVHCDLRVVDSKRRQMAPSFVDYQGINPFRNSFTRLLVSNVVTGCTALFNEELADLALPVPRDAIMHDWWLALVAGAFGRLSFVEEQLMDYRQHGRNTLGARESVRSDLQGLLSRLTDHRHDEIGKALAVQARAFDVMYGKILKPRQRLLLKLVGGLENGSVVKRNLLMKIFHVVAT